MKRKVRKIGQQHVRHPIHCSFLSDTIKILFEHEKNMDEGIKKYILIHIR